MMTDFSSEITREQLAEYRRSHIGALFLHAHRVYSELALAKLRAHQHDTLTNAHAMLLASIDLDGTHLTVLAERVGVTKQAVGQMVDDLEKKGYIQREPDSTDRRAILIKFTEMGWKFLHDAHHIKKEIETEYAAILGEEKMEQLRTLLLTLIDHYRENR